MSNGDDQNDDNGTRAPGERRSRRRKAVRPAVIEGEAQAVPGERDATPADTDADSPVDTPAPDTGETTADTESAPGSTQYSETGAETEIAAGTDTAPDESGDGAGEPGGDAAGEDPGPGADDSERAVGASAPEPAPAHLPTARPASVIAAGVIGAVVALGAYLAADHFGVLPRAGATNAELAGRIQDLNRRVGDVQSTVRNAARQDIPAAVADRFAALETSISELGDGAANGLAGRIGDIESRIEDLAGSLSQGASSVASDLESRLSDIENRVAGVESRPAVVSADGQPVDDTAVEALNRRIAALDTQMKQTADAVDRLQSADSGAAADRLSEIETTLAALRADLDKLSGSVGDMSAQVDRRIASLRKTVEETSRGPGSDLARATAATLALTALQRTADAGRPYAAELDVLRPLVTDKADLSVLAAHADTGVPDLATLQSTFDGAASAIMAAGEGEGDGVVGSLVDSARSLVRVRPAGKTEGPGRGAIVSRIGAALRAGDLTTAGTEWDSLGDAGKTASQDWAGGLKARIAVNAALADLSSKLTASLTAGGTAAAVPPATTGSSAADDSSQPNGAAAQN